MVNTNKAIDTYIEESAVYAQPILIHLRKLIHEACPDIEEKIKWGMPFFDYKGPVCNFAAFRQHCSFGFWKASLMKDPILKRNAENETAMGHMGRITSLKDLPSDKKIIAYIKEAVKLNEEGKNIVRLKKEPLKDIEVPDYFIAALCKNASAKKVFEAFTVSMKKEYIMWTEEAKTDITRDKRLAQAIEWIAEGKTRNWKYK